MKNKSPGRIFLAGFPYDEKSSFMRGCAKAPPLIRESLYSPGSNTTAENGVDIRREDIVDTGDHRIGDLMEVEGVIAGHLKAGDRVLSIGGDHSVSFPILKAYVSQYPDLEILHIDAHPDLYDHLKGDRLSHACPFARIMEAAPSVRLVQMGIRTLNAHQKAQSEKFGTEMIEIKDFHRGRVPVFTKPLYISIDLDGIDPAFAPGVSHHEPGGFSSREVINLIGGTSVPVVGGDVVEYNPERDVCGITSALAGKLTKELLSKMVENGTA